MDAREEYEFYRDPEHLKPQGPPRRRRRKADEMLSVRVSSDLLQALRRRARDEDRSVNWVVRRAIENHLRVHEDQPPTGG